VVAAGGDGTVGAVANQLAESRLVMAVLPLGTSNDFARSLGIPLEIAGAVELLTSGKVSTVDLGRVVMQGRPPVHFVHAATAGINVSFARMATRASLRKRLGRLTYVVAAVLALRHHQPFDATLSFDGGSQSVRLTHLSVLNAPVFGGPLGLRVPGSDPDDRRLDVLALEHLPMREAIRALTLTVLGIRPPVRGFYMLHVPRLAVHTSQELDVALDGEVAGKLPAEFVVAGEALRVVTPDDFEDRD
jgi:YegS/Rv2252/BmrU family lipid kinase